MQQRALGFRAWHEQSNCFYYMHLDELIGLTRTISMPSNSIIEQFTGLIDKNQIEIYEGDILKIYINRFVDRKQEYYYGEVYYDRDRFSIRIDNLLNKQIKQEFEYESFSKKENFPTVCCLVEDGATVLGNIHEDKNLYIKKI